MFYVFVTTDAGVLNWSVDRATGTYTVELAFGFGALMFHLGRAGMFHVGCGRILGGSQSKLAEVAVAVAVAVAVRTPLRGGSVFYVFVTTAC